MDTKRDKCIICNSSYITLLITFLKIDTNNDTDIDITYCTNCFHIQLQNILPISDSILYSNFINTELLEITPYKQYLVVYYNSDFDYTPNRNNITYLNLCDFKLEDLENYTQYDTIFCSDILTKHDNPSYILNIIKQLSYNTTEIYIESPNSDIIKNTKFDTITKSQISYFSTYSMRTLCNNNNLHIHHVSYYGHNAIYKIGFADSLFSNITDVILNELDHDLYTIETYTKYTIKYIITRNTIRNLLLYYYLMELQL
jgi:hypothetical protein